MYAMSAAHKSLRIPGYARVTNLDNGRSVIVRVNDRGPFHGDRLIDLSSCGSQEAGLSRSRHSPGGGGRYHGSSGWRRGSWRASCLSPLAKVQAPVQVASQNLPLRRQHRDRRCFVQLGAFSSRDPAEALLAVAREATETPARLREVSTGSGRFHRVQVGPFPNEDEARYARNLLESRGFSAHGPDGFALSCRRHT